MQVDYRVNQKITASDFIDLLKRSGLAERRPVDDAACIEAMVKHANLTVTAWDQKMLVGIARSMTDFHYACYLSDLAVDKSYQKVGIGKKLQAITQRQLGPQCTLILLAAPSANDYYRHIGFNHHPRCWVLEPDNTIDLN